MSRRIDRTPRRRGSALSMPPQSRPAGQYLLQLEEVVAPLLDDLEEPAEADGEAVRAEVLAVHDQARENR